jgi:glycosyltransferase involved in cell wall biosynthesis/CelD/BcsL family acetyltransferase involved in cellulose biosynthesis
VLYVTDIYGGHHGGSEGQLVALVKGLPPDWSPRLLVLQRSPWLFTEGFPAPVTKFGLGSTWNPFTWLRLLALARRLRRWNVDLVHTYHSHASIVMPLVGALARVPVIVSRRDLGFWQTPGKRAVLRRTGRFVAATIANARAVKEQAVRAEHLPPATVHVVANGHPRERFAAAADPDLRAALGIPVDARVVGLLANLKPLKRQADLVDALAILRTRFPDVHVLLIGTGSESDRKGLLTRAEKAGLAGRVHVHGVTGDVVPVLKHLAVGVLCSDTEGLSNAILEYLACGLPVVATDVGGNPELVADGECGILYPVGRVDRLAEHLARLLGDEGLRTRMGAAARARFEGRFALERMVAETVDRYERVLEPPPPAPPWTWSLITDLPALRVLEAEWGALTGPRRFFVGPTWVLTWLEQQRGAVHPVVFAARDANENLVGVAPFVRRGRTLVFAGQDEGADHLDVVAAPENALSFARAVLARFTALPWRRLVLRHVADDAALRVALREKGRRLAYTERPASVAPWIDASGTHEAWLQRAFEKKQRHEMRRTVKRFREHPASAVERVTTPAGVDLALEGLMSLLAAAFAARGQPTVFRGERVRAFHTALAKQAAMDGSLWLPTLKTGGVPLAAFYGFRWKGVLHHFQSGVDPARRSFGPGNVLRSIALEEDVFGAGLVDYDFMDGDEAYKSGWTDKVRVLYDVVVEKPTFGGRTRSLLRGFAGLVREGLSTARTRLRERRAARAAARPAPKEPPPPAPPAPTEDGPPKAWAAEVSPRAP